MVVGYGADADQMQAVADGIEAAVFAERPYQIGYESVRVLKRIFSGEKIEDAVVPVGVARVDAETLPSFLKSPDAEMLRQP
jgi:ABC-type sugar transport system substrate-binding protein